MIVGTRCRARYLADKLPGFLASKTWYPGVITRCHPDGSFDIEFDDGDSEEHVLSKFVKEAKPEAMDTKPEATGPKPEAVDAKPEAVDAAHQPEPVTDHTPPPPHAEGLSAYEVERASRIAQNDAKLENLGLKEAKFACRTEKKKPKKRKRDPEAQPKRNSRRLNGAAAVDIFVEEDEGRQLTLGGDAEEAATLNAEQRAIKEAQRAAAWESARARAALNAVEAADALSAGGPPDRAEFVDLGTPVFHLNSFIVSEHEVNRAFGLFLSESIATPGFCRVSGSTLEHVHRHWPLDESYHPTLREMLVDEVGYTPSSAGQVATWLSKCRPGAYIVCRHIYKNCPHTPAALRGPDGSYLGGVYAIGRVMEFPPPQSPEDDKLVEHISTQRLDLLDMDAYYLHANAKVEFFALGYLDDLREQTMGYINQVCQPTLNQMLKGQGKDKDYHRQCHNDLWDKATVKITPGMISDAPAANASSMRDGALVVD